ncbi:hypothetical protein AOLI_G00107540 [Acnodon oligacanthus]
MPEIQSVRLTRIALIESGTRGNFIHAKLVDQLPLEPLKTPLKLAAADEDPVAEGIVSHLTKAVRMTMRNYSNY